MQIPLTTMEQLMPFPTANEIIMKKKEPMLSVPPGTMVIDALKLMAERDVRFMLIMDNKKLSGVISERDCARRVILGRLAAESTPVRDIMTKDVSTVPPETKITECIMLMYRKDVGYLPVMHGSEIIGVLSARELLGALIERHERLLKKLAHERLTMLYPDPSSY